MAGYLKAQRDRFKHPLFRKEKFCRGYAWDWMCAKARFAPTEYDVRGDTVMVDRGQFIASPDEMAEAWNWSRSAVNRFLTRLKSEHMIEQSTGHKKTLITIRNYEEYQSKSDEAGHKSEHKSGHKPDTNRTPKNKGKELNEGIKKEDTALSEFSSPPIDEVSKAVSAYNAAAERVGWPSVQKLTPARRTALKARLRDVDGATGWEHALAKAEASPFLTGQTDKPFRLTFDFLIKQANFTKLMEGNYDPRNQSRTESSTSSSYHGKRGPHNSFMAGFGYVANRDH